MVVISKAGSFDIRVGPFEVNSGHGQDQMSENKISFYKICLTFATVGYQPMKTHQKLPLSQAPLVVFIWGARQRHQWSKSYLNVFSYTRWYRRMNSIPRFGLFFQPNIFFPILKYIFRIIIHDS